MWKANFDSLRATEAPAIISPSVDQLACLLLPLLGPLRSRCDSDLWRIVVLFRWDELLILGQILTYRCPYSVQPKCSWPKRVTICHLCIGHHFLHPKIRGPEILFPARTVLMTHELLSVRSDFKLAVAALQRRTQFPTPR
jgi:hypothetical protein